MLQTPTAAFSVKGVAEPEAPVAFANQSTGTALTYVWDFGDGSPLNQDKEPVHIFAESGVYTVRLTAANLVGEDIYTVDLMVMPRFYLPLIRQAP